MELALFTGDSLDGTEKGILQTIGTRLEAHSYLNYLCML